MLSDRDIGAGLEGGLARERVGLALLFFADWPGDPVRMWTGTGDLVYAGDTYAGMGHLVDVTPVEETTDTKSAAVTVGVSGLENAQFSVETMEAVAWQGRTCRVWLAHVDHDTGIVAGDPYLLFEGLLDSDETTDDGQAITVQVTAVRRDGDHLRQRPLRYTDEDQQLLYPDEDDDGLEFVVRVQSNNLRWGA